MPITSASGLLTYHWNIWYFLAAILGSMASLFLGAWIWARQASPTNRGYSFFFEFPCIPFLYLMLGSEVHYGVYPAGTHRLVTSASCDHLSNALIIIL